MRKKTKDETITDEETTNANEILVVTSDIGSMGTRGGGPQSLKVEELAVNVNLFVQQMGKVLESTPATLGKFDFDEFEFHAEITADGTLAVLGSGVRAGMSGGLRFVFRRNSASSR